MLWALADLAVTGDALHSLHGTADLAETADRRRDPLTGPYWAAKYLGYALREPLVIGVPIGLAFAWRHARARAWLPFLTAVAMLVVFLAGPLFGLPLIARYVRAPAVLLAVFYGLAVMGWQMLPREARDRRGWVIAGAVAALLSVAYLPVAREAPARASRTGSTSRAPTTATCAPRRRRRRSARAFDRCGKIATADHRPIPHLRWWIEGDPGSVAPVGTPEARGARVLLLPRRTRAMKRFYTTKFPRVTAPAGYQRVYRNASWRVLAAPECG